MQKLRWIFKPEASPDEVKHLQFAINASPTLAAILSQRGLRTFNEVKQFFTFDLRQLHSPFLMKDMDKAVDRITTAINAQENILVYGDYDVDGTTAVALVYAYLTMHYKHVSYYIPDRYKEGYGVSKEGIDFAADNNITLIIALDCGIKAIEQVKYAQSKGIDFVVCDHHLPGTDLPEAVAILNPLQAECNYPFKALCGCGIGFKLVQALNSAWDEEESSPFQFVDLVAIATGADIVPMIGENRLLVHFGLRSMERALRPGLYELLDKVGLTANGKFNKSEMTVSDLVFKIAPRINAAGRMNHGSIAVELLNAKTALQAKRFAAELDQNNSDRKEEDKRVVDEAKALILENETLLKAKSTFVFKPDWHKGVIGIAASRLQDDFYRPTIVLTSSNEKIAGSARSIKGFDIHEAIEACSDLLLNFGGHPAAAGMTLLPSNLEEFGRRFELEVASRLTVEQMIPALEVDLEIDLSALNQKLVEQLNRLAPFGPFNPKPVFVTRNLKVTKNTRKVGDDHSHLKLEVHPIGNTSLLYQGIAFGMGELMDQWVEGQIVDLAYTAEFNEFRGKKTIQLMVRDIHFKNISEKSSLQYTVAESNT
jgi:single-stranded-DNA-specific exonuclease